MIQLYKLRRDFSILGITGKSGAGCSEIGKLLNEDNFKEVTENDVVIESNDVDELKYKICYNFLNHPNNWNKYSIINYTNILVLHLLFDAKYSASTIDSFRINVLDIIINHHNRGGSSRFNTENRKELIEAIKRTVDEDLYSNIKQLVCGTLSQSIRGTKTFSLSNIEEKISQFIIELKRVDYFKTKILLHDIANNLRGHGSTKFNQLEPTLDKVYTVAETINQLIKKLKVDGKVKIVIDALKNSLELAYFKEKFAGFYCIAVNRIEDERLKHKTKEIKGFCSEDELPEVLELNEKLSNTEHGGSDVNSGKFTAPDIENCIQKADYHIFHASQTENSEFYENLGYKKNDVSLKRQLIKLIALIQQPGIITPSTNERLMQMAFNAKYNSGCISRQVGAVITDENGSIKGVGWNDVAANQIPCNLRSLIDLKDDKNSEHFSEFEKGESSDAKEFYKSGKDFKTAISEITIESNKLEGRNCSFCFKSCHNAYELKDNQVHTRSLHAEENAMLQITKYGGQGVKNGKLFTTASPCELCSKKAFQLGVKEIYYIDPYPGIAGNHILKGGRDIKNNPKLKMFIGAVGRGFHKLYEPLMAYKDELNILSDIHPKKDKRMMVNTLTNDNEKIEEIMRILKES
jgi:deoxycytidylate deaminase